jgi:hypothetical protein
MNASPPGFLFSQDEPVNGVQHTAAAFAELAIAGTEAAQVMHRSPAATRKHG